MEGEASGRGAAKAKYCRPMCYFFGFDTRFPRQRRRETAGRSAWPIFRQATMLPSVLEDTSNTKEDKRDRRQRLAMSHNQLAS